MPEELPNNVHIVISTISNSLGFFELRRKYPSGGFLEVPTLSVHVSDIYFIFSLVSLYSFFYFIFIHCYRIPAPFWNDY